MVVGQPPLITRSLLLRPLSLEDVDIACALSNEESARKWLPSQVYRDIAHATSAVQFLIRQQSDPGDPRLGAYVLAIERKAEPGMIGHVGLSPLDRDVEVGFGIALAYQKKLSEQNVFKCMFYKGAVSHFVFGYILAYYD